MIENEAGGGKRKRRAAIERARRTIYIYTIRREKETKYKAVADRGCLSLRGQKGLPAFGVLVPLECTRDFALCRSGREGSLLGLLCGRWSFLPQAAQQQRLAQTTPKLSTTWHGLSLMTIIWHIDDKRVVHCSIAKLERGPLDEPEPLWQPRNRDGQKSI